MQLTRIIKYIIIIQIIYLSGCEYYDHSNPLDPNYQGGIIRNLKIHSFYIDDAIGNNLPYSGGNGDSIINKGEQLKVFIKLANLGNSVERNVSATPQLLSNSDIQITNYYLKYGDISPDDISDGDHDINSGSGTYGHAYVELQIGKSVNSKTSFLIILKYSQNTDTINLICEKTGAEIINYGADVSYDLPSGNQYWFRPAYKIKNIGTSLTRLVNITKYSSSDPNISFSGNSVNAIGDMKAGEVKSSGFDIPDIVVSNSLHFPYNTSVTITLEDLFGNNWLLKYDLTLVH